MRRTKVLNEKMLRFTRTHSFSSRHLVVIPKAPPIQPQYEPPVSVDQLSNELSRLLHDAELPQPGIFAEAAVNLSRDCGPREIQKLIMVMDRHKIYSSELRKYIIDRVEKLGLQMSLSSLLTVYSKFKLPSISRLIQGKITAENMTGLPNNKLVALLEAVPGDGLVMTELTRRLKRVDLSQIATSLNFVKRYGHLSPSIERFIDTSSREIARRSSLDPNIPPRDISIIFNSYGYFGKSQPEFIKALIDYAVPRFATFSPLQTAMVLHSIAKQDIMDFRLFDIFATSAKLVNYKGSSKAVGMILYAMGRSEYKNEPILSGLTELIKRDISSYDFQSMAFACYGFSKLGHLPPDLLDSVSEEIIYRSTVKRNSRSLKYTATDIGMIAKFFGHSAKRLGRPSHPELAYTLVELVKRHPGRNKRQVIPTPESVVSIVEAFVSLDKSRVSGLEFWISKNLHALVSQLGAVQIFSLLSSLIKMGIHNKPLYKAILDSVNPDLVDYKLVPKLLLKLSKIPSGATIVDSRVIKNLSKVLSVNLAKYTDISDLATMMYGLSELNYRDEKLNGRLVMRIGSMLDNNAWYENDPSVVLSMLAVATARLRIVETNFHEKLYNEIFKHINSAFKSERSITNILYAIATASGSGDMDSQVSWVNPVVDVLLGRLVDTYHLPDEGIRQVQIVSLWLRGTRKQPRRVEEWLDRISSINTYKTSSVEQSSESHRDISRYLLQLGLQHTNEAVFGPFSFDIYVPQNKTVIEIDGPHHFFRDSIIRTSSSVLKHKLLESIGFKLVHVPYHEWIQCTSESRKLAYCNSIAAIART